MKHLGTALYCTALHCTALQLHSTVLHCTVANKDYSEWIYVVQHSLPPMLEKLEEKYKVVEETTMST
jgi:hypothetical protein